MRAPLHRLIFGYGISGLAIVAGLLFIDVDWRVGLDQLSVMSAWAVVAAVCAFLLHGVLNAVAFGIMLGGYARCVSPREGAGVWAASILAKYVPGSVWHIAARGGLLQRWGVPSSIVVATGLIEQAISVAATVSIAVILLWASGVVSGVLAIAVLTMAALGLGLLRWVLVRGRGEFVSVCWAALIYLLSMLPFCAGYLLVVRPEVSAHFLGWLFAGTAGGALSFVTPGGLGVREAIVASAMQDVPGLLVTAIAARVLIVASECLLMSLAGLNYWFVAHRPPVHREPRQQPQPRVVALGVGLRGEGYPNAENTLRLIAELRTHEVVDNVRWLPPGMHLWKVFRGGLLRRFTTMAKLGANGLVSALGALRSNRGDICYAPYPAVLVLWWLSWVPRRLRPRVVADAYISIWDSAFRDRGPDVGSLAGRLVRHFEARALRAADLVVADTSANRCWMIDLFRLEPRRVVAWPLAIDAAQLLAIDRGGCGGAASRLKVLFVGTLVPLHGTPVLAKVVERLAQVPGVEVTIIGDGQDAPLLEAAIASMSGHSVTWIREWQGLEALVQHFADADVVLGVFGGGGKAARVLPFKIYMALASGATVVTQQEYSRPDATPPAPLLTVEPTPDAVVAAIMRVLMQREQLAVSAKVARHYYLKHLGKSRLSALWKGVLADFGARS